MLRNPFETPGEWYKANLHTHTTASDGQATLQERIDQYRSRGYSVLAITDHDVVSDAAGGSTESFLIIDGVEFGIMPFDDDRFYHLLCVNAPAGLTVPEKTDMNQAIAQVKASGAECFIAHPYWSSNTIRELAPLKGYTGIEVFNSGCQGIGKGCSSVHWDQLLGAGIRTPAIGVDDVHSLDGSLDRFGGWTMLKMPELSLPAVLDALRTGCCYASSGAEILDFQVDGTAASLRCPPAREIHFMANSYCGASFYAGDGPLLTEAQADLGGMCKYIRAEVVDAKGKRAWTNPVFTQKGT
ncbi:MAG: CehA/McbA family metallohydrolase [Planctomycetes bacterium]|nr:CehA/McbA family metallohydrolase [Planctomycetota bacterium]